MGYYYPIDSGKKYFFGEQHAPLLSSIFKRKVILLPEERQHVDGSALLELKKDIEKSKADNIILSSEYFYAQCNSEDDIQLFHDAFREFEVKILVYLRRQDKFYLSNLQQGIKTGYNLSPTFEGALKDHQIYYLKRLSMWEKVFGQSKLVVRPFEKQQWENGDLLDDVQKVLGIEKNQSLKKVEVQNKSISLKRLLLLQKFNSLYGDNNDTTSKKYWEIQHMRSILANISRNWLGDLLSEGNAEDIMSPKDRLKIISYFEEENRILAEKFNPSVRNFFAEEYRISDYNAEQIDLSEQELLLVLRRILEVAVLTERKLYETNSILDKIKKWQK